MMLTKQLTRGREFSPLSMVRALWKWRGLIVVVWVLGSVGVAAVVHRLRPVYRADAVILVESQKIPEVFVTATVQAAMEARMDALKQQALSRERLWNLAVEMDLYPEQRRKLTREEVVEIMRKDIGINLERAWTANRPGAFRVQYDARDPEVAAEVVNRIALFFINENLRQREAEAEDTSKFLKSQLEESERKLQIQEARLKELKMTHIGELPQEQGALLASMGQNRTELQGVQDALARAQQNKLVLENSLMLAERSLEERLESLRRARAAAAKAVESSQVSELSLSAPSPELARLESQLRAARLRYHEAHPEVQRLKQEFELLARKEAEREEALQAARREEAAGGSQAAGRKGGAGAPEAPVGDTEQQLALMNERARIQDLRSRIEGFGHEIETLEARRRRVLEEAADLKNRIRNVPVREQELATITRDYETSRRNYESLLNKKLAADLAADMERLQKAQKFVLLDHARAPEKPVRPKRALLTAAGAAFALVAAMALAFLLELRRNVLLGEWELPAGVVILGRVPGIEGA